MGSKHPAVKSHEATVKSIGQIGGDFYIKIDPPIPGRSDTFDRMIISATHVDCLKMYKYIEREKTYRFYYHRGSTICGCDSVECVIIDITDPEIYTADITVRDIIDIGKQNDSFGGYVQVIFAAKSSTQLICKRVNAEGMMMGQKYSVRYEKAFGANIYLLKSWEKI